MPVSKLAEFIQVAETLNFSRAADYLGMDQSTLSKHVSTLEARLGVKLFERDTRSVRLTAAGESLYRDAVDIVDQYRRSVERARSISLQNRPTIRVGGNLGNIRMFMLAERLRAYVKAHKMPFEVEVVQGSTGVAVTKPNADEPFEGSIEGSNHIDLLFLSNEVYSSGLKVVPLYKDELAVYVLANSGFADGQNVCLAQLKHLRLVEPTTWRIKNKRIKEIYAQTGITPATRPHIIEYVSDIPGSLGPNEVFVLAGSMTQLMPPHSASGIARLHIVDPHAYLEVGAVYLPKHETSEVLACVRALQQLASEL